jgi:hypothetical protein
MKKQTNEERQMDKNASDFLKHKVASALMKRHGWDRTNSLHKAEFDPTNPDSQYAMAYDDAEVAVETFISALLELDGSTIEPSPEVAASTPDPVADTGRPEGYQNPSVQKSASIFIFMDSGKGNPAFVGDVRDWLEEVDSAGIPDSTEVDGRLYLSYDVEPTEIISGEDVVTGEEYIVLTDPTVRESL